MNTNKTQTGAGNTTAAQILNNLTLAQAYAHSATADKAAYIVELLGVKSIHSPLFVEMEDAIEERFHQLRVADNRNRWHKIPAPQNLTLEQRIVSHPDQSRDSGVFALLDIYGDYYRSHHGYVMPFTEDAARAMIGLPRKF